MMHHWPHMTTGKTGRHGKARHATKLVAAVGLEMKSPSSPSPWYLWTIIINGLFGLCHKCYEDCPEVYTRTRSFICDRDFAGQYWRSVSVSSLGRGELISWRWNKVFSSVLKGWNVVPWVHKEWVGRIAFMKLNGCLLVIAFCDLLNKFTPSLLVFDRA